MSPTVIREVAKVGGILFEGYHSIKDEQYTFETL